SALAYSAYIFPEEWVDSTFHRCYVPAAVFNSVVSTSLSCYSSLVDTPLLLQFYLCAVQSCTEAAVPVHYKHTVFAFLTCFIFASHLPERLSPGHLYRAFGVVAGHSHQVFHVCGILGTYFQLEAITVDMAERRGHLLSPSSPPSPLQTLGSMGIGVATSLAVIGLCAASLRFMPEPLQREKPHGQ
ncbi:PREDICTED: membrane progestin receptor gamma-B-like, partial [Pterocles gutturalis]|uniref:membrane progestin receptor gamma-B-like n=1 Tax=Pterocles gutturalis TaxID=240206 RepID=UPI000528D5DF